jgi:acyl phosphate:glycerol-3-phosphate acyltransferase
MTIILLLFFVVCAYLVGSLCSAVIVSKLMGLPDPRTEGSGNPGATNVLRVGGKKAAIIVLLADALKGFLPVVVAHIVGLSGFALGLVAFAAVVGHIYPIFFQFEGGKGVATALGAMFGISLALGISAIIIWLGIAFATRYASLASITSIALVTLFSPWLTGSWGYFLPLVFITLAVVYRHQENITNLMAGTESKIKLAK